MRNEGQYVDKKDLARQFERYGKAYLKLLEVKVENGEDLSFSEKARQTEPERRLKNLSKDSSREFLSNTIQRFMGARFLKPQRVMSLSLEEQRGRCEATWQCMDWTMYKMLNGDAKFYKQRFCQPEIVKENLAETCLLFSEGDPGKTAVLPA